MVADYTDVMGLLKVLKLPNTTPLVKPQTLGPKRGSCKNIIVLFLQRKLCVCHTSPILAKAIRPSQNEINSMDPFAVLSKKSGSEPDPGYGGCKA